MKFPIFAALRPAAALIALSIATAAGRLSAASSTAPVAVPPPPPQSPNQNAQGFGAPVAGLNITLSADFVDGQDEFKIVRTPATGLGPIYNNVSCEACHNRPTVGGWGTITTTRFGRTASNGTFDPLTQQDGRCV